MQRFLIDMDNPDKKIATINTCIRVNKVKLGVSPDSLDRQDSPALIGQELSWS